MERSPTPVMCLTCMTCMAGAGIPHFVVAVFVLPLTLLGGPAGLGLYLAIKCMWTRSTTATERKGE